VVSEDVTAVGMKSTVFWDVSLCNLADDKLYDAPSQKTVSVVH